VEGCALETREGLCWKRRSAYTLWSPWLLPSAAHMLVDTAARDAELPRRLQMRGSGCPDSRGGSQRKLKLLEAHSRPLRRRRRLEVKNGASHKKIQNLQGAEPAKNTTTPRTLRDSSLVLQPIKLPLEPHPQHELPPHVVVEAAPVPTDVVDHVICKCLHRGSVITFPCYDDPCCRSYAPQYNQDPALTTTALVRQ